MAIYVVTLHAYSFLIQLRLEMRL